MKKKYTLSIADMEINVITDEPQESVEYIVGVLDRKMREVLLKGKRCTKNEAAVLCALEFCADKIKQKEQIEELEGEMGDLTEKLRNAEEKLDFAQQNAERADKERARLESENAKLRALLAEMKGEEKVIVGGAQEAPIASEPVAEDSVVVEEKPAEEKPATKKKTTGKNRVGTMFDLLTFSDI